MSKIITKKQLNRLIESTINEYVRDEDAIYAMPGGEEFMSKQSYNPNSPHPGSENKYPTTPNSKSNSTKNDEMSQEDIDSAMDYTAFMNEGTMCECGGMMYEGVCEECGSTGEHIEEELHGDQYKLDKNKNNKIDSEDLEMLRKEGSVEVSVNDLAESVTKTIDTSFLTENMDNFKKLINYKNK